MLFLIIITPVVMVVSFVCAIISFFTGAIGPAVGLLVIAVFCFYFLDFILEIDRKKTDEKAMIAYLNYQHQKR